MILARHKTGYTHQIVITIFLLTIFLLSAQAQNPSEATPLELGKPIMRSLDNGQEHSYQLSLSAGQYAAIGVMQQGVDVQIQLFALHGKQVTEYDGVWETNGEESIEFVAATSGQYLLKVSMTRQQMAGNYEIQLKALRVADTKDKSLEEVQVLKRMANALSREAKHKEALTLYEQSLTIIEREMGNDNLEYAAILSKISDELMRLGEFAKAEQICLRSIALYKKFLGEGNLATTNVLRTLGGIYFRTNDYPKSERAFQSALAIFEKSPGQENPKIVSVLSDFAMVFVNKGDYVTAENHLLRGLAIVEKSASNNSNSLSTIVGNLGYLYVTKGEFARAEPYVRRGLAVREKQLGPDNPANAEDLQNLAIILKEKKEYAEVLQMSQRAAVLKEKIVGADHIDLVAILNNVANIYKAQGEYEKACEAYLRILQIAEKSGGANHRTTMTIVGNLANVYVAKGDIVNALNYQARVDAVIENNIVMNLTLGSERQKLAYLDLMVPRTERTISFSLGLGAQEREAKALAALVVLQRKGRALDAMANGLVKLRQRSNPEDQVLLDRLNSVASQIARLTLNGPQKISIEEHQQKIKTLEEQKEKLEREISQRNTEFRTQTQAVTLATVQAAIPENAALLEFAVYRPFDPTSQGNSSAYGKARYAVYLLCHDGSVEAKDLGEAVVIDEAIVKLREALRDPSHKDFRTFARVVEEKVTQPLRPLLGGTKHLILSPDGALNLIPFEALVDEQNHFLIESYSFSYLSSGRDLLRLKVARNTSR